VCSRGEQAPQAGEVAALLKENGIEHGVDGGKLP